MASLAYDIPKRAIGNSFNLACSETPTLVEFLDILSLEACQKPMLPPRVVDDDGKANYPSVECGSLSIDLAKSVFNWQPTPLVAHSRLKWNKTSFITLI